MTRRHGADSARSPATRSAATRRERPHRPAWSGASPTAAEFPISPLALRLDQSVAAVAPPVDHVDLIRLVVAKHEEVVADKLQLQCGFFSAHRLHRELLRLDDVRAYVFVGCHRTSGRDAVATRLPSAALGAVVLDLATELVGQLVDRRLHVRGGLARTQRRPLRPDGCLRHLICRDRRVLLDAQLELDLRQLVQLAVELAQLLFGIPADRIADLVILALHVKSHRVSLSRAGERSLSDRRAPAARRSESGPHAPASTETGRNERATLAWPRAAAGGADYRHRITRAKVTISTLRAPAARNAEAAALAVAPVV